MLPSLFLHLNHVPRKLKITFAHLRLSKEREQRVPLADLSLDGDWPICDTQGSAVAGSGVVLHVEEDHPGALV